MAALPFRFTGDERLLAGSQATTDQTGDDVSPSAGSVPAAPPRELTVRALTVGLAIGAVLAAGNVYTGLKSSWIDGGALTAALLSFTFFATFKRLARMPFGPFENNVAQTAAASAAGMVFVHGLMAPMPALEMMGQHHAPWALWLWGITLALVGLVLGLVLRRKLVVEDALPFPTGTATAELIRSVHANQGSAERRTRLLVIAVLAAGALTWFRDGRPSLIPQALYLPITLGGVTAASLTLGIASSPLMLGTGMFVGLRGSLSLLSGGAIAWAVLAPVAIRYGWTKDGSYGALASWLVWPAFGMMMATTFVPVFLGWRKLLLAARQVLRDARNVLGRSVNTTVSPPSRARDRLVGVGTVLLASALLAWTGWRAFGFSPILTCAALALSVVLAGICARAAGETDVAPVGAFGTITQIVFAGGGPTSSILAGAIVAGNATEVAQSMWAFKAGHSLRASIRAQFIAQVLGAIVGSVVVVPVYLLVTRAYPLGSEQMPAVAAVSWKATAEALSGGLGALPPYGIHAIAIGFGVGAVLCVLGRGQSKLGAYLPSAIALSIGMIMPASMSATAALGAGVLTLLRHRMPTLAGGEGNALAAGLLAGESLLGVVIAALVASGLLSF